MKEPIKLILFDLGGVLVELGPSPLPSDWLHHASPSFSVKEWFSSPSATHFERGLCTPMEFATALKSELGITASRRDILSAFKDWPRGLMPGVTTLLEQLAPHYRLAVLSNSNEIHWPQLSQELGLQHYMEQLYSSHLLHKSKPDPAIFQQVLNELSLVPEQVLFFDDNQHNIDSAQALGIRSHLVNGPQEIRHILDFPVLQT
ncbi:HAD family hydrolase [Arenicella xantha]|nr:HAD family phosphatase [Arenicella xantha]